MDTKNYFKDVYEDFFGVEKAKELLNSETNIKESQDYMEDVFPKIDKLRITEESKTFLKQLLEYMRKYKEGIESLYIPFHILIKSNDTSVIEEVVSYIKHAMFFYSYGKSSLYEESMYHFTNTIRLDNIYDENGLIYFKDLAGISLFELNSQKTFYHDLRSALKEKQCITILSGSKVDLDTFFVGEESVLDMFSFTIESRYLDVQDIYEEVIEKTHLNEEEYPQLLDYISKTLKEVEDVSSYTQKLVEYIIFHKRVPELEKEKSLEDVFASLNELVGLEKVKKVLHDLVDLKEFKGKSDVKLPNLNLHMVFLGNPGTGKTTVARIVSSILYHLKYIKQDKLIEVSSKDLVAEYVGQTAPKTMHVIESALGGVLFIDEAYALAVKGENSYNAEAIATLIQAMENYREELVVIFAGYTKEMQDFLSSNSGIVSRIGYTLEFDDYTEDELVEIFFSMTNKAGFQVEAAAIDYLREIIKTYQHMDNFGNARFIRNIYEKSIIKHASNTKGKKRKDILRTITKEDISIENLILD